MMVLVPLNTLSHEGLKGLSSHCKGYIFTDLTEGVDDEELEDKHSHHDEEVVESVYIDHVFSLASFCLPADLLVNFQVVETYDCFRRYQSNNWKDNPH